jgi:predicted lipid-binding transport protein (Tim44 family)
MPLSGRKEMEKFVQITRYPAGRAGLALGLLAGFVAAFMGEARRMFLLIGLFVGLIAFWQHVLFSGVRPELPPSSKQQVDKGD